MKGWMRQIGALVRRAARKGPRERIRREYRLGDFDADWHQVRRTPIAAKDAGDLDRV